MIEYRILLFHFSEYQPKLIVLNKSFLPPSTYRPSGRKKEGAAPDARAAFQTNCSSGREVILPGDVGLDNSGCG